MLARESTFRLGFALGLISIALYLALTSRLYELFRPVNRNFSLLAAFFSLVGCAVQAFGSVFQLAPLILTHSVSESLTIEQVRAGLDVFAGLYTLSINLGFFFFGLYCLSIGYLILHSTFLPRFLGALLGLAGLGWLTFLAPALAAALSPYIQAVGVLAEALLMLWLIVFGVKTPPLTQQANRVDY